LRSPKKRFRYFRSLKKRKLFPTMRTPVLILTAGLILSAGNTAIAQSKTKKEVETQVLKQDADRPQTIIEISGATVIINGDTVRRDGDGIARKKIIIDREDDAPGSGFGGFGMGNGLDFGGGQNASPKARLGVFTDPERSTGGAYIREVQPGSPAQAAGLKEGDKITSIDGTSIKSAEDLIETIGAHAPEDTVKIAYERSGKKNNAVAYLEAAPAPPAPRGGMRSFGGPQGGGEMPDLSQLFGGGGGLFGGSADGAAPKLGVTVEERADGSGVRILEVEKDGLAGKTGLKEDDVLTQLGSTKITSPQSLQSALRKMQGESTTLRYLRNGKELTAKMSIPKKLKKMDL
jgi:hypothetical protein